MSKAAFPLRKFVAPEIIFGLGALELVGQYARHLGGSKALVVSDAGVTQAGWLAKVSTNIAAAGLRQTAFTAVSPNPRLEEVEQGVAVFAEEACDIILAVGGGSVIDCAKGIGVLAANGGQLSDFLGVDNVGAPMVPTICLPTTAGTSADVSQFAVLRDAVAKRKRLIISKAVVPDLTLLDPTLLVTMNANLTACTGMDALVHAIEAYVSTGSSPLTDLHALQAVRLLSRNLLASLAEPDNLAYRNEMMLGSLEAGLAFSNASLGAVHALSHSLGGAFDLAHGECNALLLDRVVDFNFPASEERYCEIALALGLPVGGQRATEVRQALTTALRTLREQAGIRGGLAARGIHRTDVSELAADALDDPCMVTNPCCLTQRDVEVLYEESL